MYQFRLSSLMILVTVLAVFFAVPGMFGLSSGPWIVAWVCLALCVWSWKSILTTEILLSGSTVDQAMWRLLAGTAAGGALFGNVVLLFVVIISGAPNDFEAVIAIPILFLLGTVLGVVLAGFPVFFLGMFVSVLFLSLEDSTGRAICSAVTGSVVGLGWTLLFFVGNGLVPDIYGVFTILIAAGFGAVGGATPELLKIRHDGRLAALAENTVPRETVVEVD